MNLKNIKSVTTSTRYYKAGIFMSFFGLLALPLIALGFPEVVAGNNASAVTVSSASGTYSGTTGSISLSSTASTINLNIAPTSSSQTVSNAVSDTVSVTTSNLASWRVYLTMSGSDNNLYLDGNSSNNTTGKYLGATTNTSATLSTNSWGISTDSGSTYHAVPVSLTSSSSATNVSNALLFSNSTTSKVVYYKASANNSMTPGTYKNTVTYTAIADAGSSASAATISPTEVTYASGTSTPVTVTVPLFSNMPDAMFGASYVTMTFGSNNDSCAGSITTAKSNGVWAVTCSAVPSETAGSTHAVNVTFLKFNKVYSTTLSYKQANICKDCSTATVNLAVNGSYEFDYSGKIVEATITNAGTYKLEVWGAQGGNSYGSKYTGGYGGYSYGNYSSSANQTLYVVVGQYPGRSSTGGYNGGANAGASNGGGGGGATHIATRTGLLSTLSSYVSDILIVAGAGSGAGYGTGAALNGLSGGGIYGASLTEASSNNQCITSYVSGISGGNCSPGKSGGQDSSGNPISGGCGGSPAGEEGGFGLGGTGVSPNGISGGGGGGYYGGKGGNASASNSYGCSGGAGSGYIGNSSLSSKGMYMYNGGYVLCTSSTTTATKTTCTSSTGHAVSNAANTGNGYAKITRVS